MCHIFLVLHFQIGQPILGTNLVFYSIMVVCLASQILPEVGTIIFLEFRRSSLLARSYQCYSRERQVLNYNVFIMLDGTYNIHVYSSEYLT